MKIHFEKIQRASNSKAMRAALEKIEKMAHCDLCNVHPKYRDKFNDMIGGIEHEARAALSAPPENCDVGMAEEQQIRFNSFCAMHLERVIGLDRMVCRPDCPLKDGNSSCELAWAQMPYESEAKE